MSGEILLIPGEDGKFHQYKPYASIDVATEEDYKFLVIAVDKQKALEPKLNKESNVFFCPECERRAKKNYDLYCSGCGQKLDWSLIKDEKTD